MRVAVTTALILLALGPSFASPGLSPHEIKVQDSVGVLQTVEADTRSMSQAVAFRASRLGTDFLGVSHALGIRARYSLTAKGHGPMPIRPVLACSAASGYDVALYRTPMTMEPPPFAEAALTLPEGESLTVVSAPSLRRSHPYVRVRVTSARRPPAGTSDAFQMLWLDAGRTLRPGYSGSPVVDRQGRIVGLISAIIVGTDLAIAVPVERIFACVSKSRD